MVTNYSQYDKLKGNEIWGLPISLALAGILLYGGWKYMTNQSRANAKPNLETKVVQTTDTNNTNSMNDLESEKLVSYKPNEAYKSEKVKPHIEYKTSDFSKDSDRIILARAIYGEARNCSDEEKIAVAHTVINRVNDGKKWNGENVKDVILKPWQYSCFNKNDVNYEKLKNPDKKIFERCLKVADEVLQGKYENLNKGQTHYFNPKVVKPKWADKMYKIGKIGNSKHEFYIEK